MCPSGTGDTQEREGPVYTLGILPGRHPKGAGDKGTQWGREGRGRGGRDQARVPGSHRRRVSRDGGGGAGGWGERWGPRVGPGCHIEAPGELNGPSGHRGGKPAESAEEMGTLPPDAGRWMFILLPEAVKSSMRQRKEFKRPEGTPTNRGLKSSYERLSPWKRVDQEVSEQHLQRKKSTAVSPESFTP